MFLFVSVDPLLISQTWCFCGKSSLWPLQEGYGDSGGEYAEVADEWERNYVEFSPSREVVCDCVIKCAELTCSSSSHMVALLASPGCMCLQRANDRCYKLAGQRGCSVRTKVLGGGLWQMEGRAGDKPGQRREAAFRLCCAYSLGCVWLRPHEAGNQSLRVSQRFKVKAVNW